MKISAGAAYDAALRYPEKGASTMIDWTPCELIEQVPGKVSGRPIVRGTRILPDAIVNSYDAGEPLDLIREDYPGLSIEQIQRLIEFAQRRQPVP
jgi:uncharacterized protein (DUF433 family)